MGSIQLGPTLTSWAWTMSFASLLALPRCSTRIIQGSFHAEEVASVASESAWVLPLLEMCDKLNRSKLGRRRLTWLRYSFILTSLASISPFTWPTTSLESENISTTFPLIFCTMAIPCNKASYSASLFVVENPSLKEFSMVALSGKIRTSPTPDPLWFAASSTYTFQHRGFGVETTPTDFPSRLRFSVNISIGGLANSATRSAKTWPFMEV